MIEHDSIKVEDNIEKMFDNLITLFNKNGLTELSEKCTKILKNYYYKSRKQD